MENVTITPTTSGEIRETAKGKQFTKFKASIPDGSVQSITVWSTLQVTPGQALTGVLREDAPFKGTRQFTFNPVYVGAVAPTQSAAARPAPAAGASLSRFTYASYRGRLRRLMTDAKADVDEIFPDVSADTKAEIAERVAVHFSIAIDMNNVEAPDGLMAPASATIASTEQVAALKKRIYEFARMDKDAATKIAESFLSGVGKDWGALTLDEVEEGMKIFAVPEDEIPF